MVDSAPDDSWTRFAMAVFALNASLIRAGESIVAPLGQSSARWQVLAHAFHPTTVAAMAREIGHARQSVQRVADILVREGLLEYVPHPVDRRTQLAGLTTEGRTVLEEIYARQLAWSLDVVAVIGEPRLNTVTESLVRIVQTLRDPPSDPPQKEAP